MCNRPAPLLRRLLRCCCILLCCCLLAGCTAQSIPLGQRAMVRLIYLEAAPAGYRALTVVCDFADGGENAALVQTAQAPTLQLALESAAAAQGGKPFFAQNKLLLLSPQLAAEQLYTVADFFAADCGSYRDPSVWVWEAGPDILTKLEKPMDLVRLAETLTDTDPHSCVKHVLELDPTQPTQLPVLRVYQTADGKSINVAVGGVRQFDVPARPSGA